MNDQERLWLEEQGLVLRAQLGDSVALGCLVGRWQGRLWRVARRLTGDDAAAWDVVQETWTAVVRGIGGLDSPRAFAAWVYRILAASAAGWRRRQMRHRRALDRLSREPGKCESGEAAWVDRSDELAAALECLDAEHLAVVSLHYGEGLGVGQVAQVLSIPSGTVKSRLFHARELLRERLGGDKHE